MKQSQFIKGLKAGIPIALGYLSVSFAFGIMAVGMGFFWWQAVLISMMNLTSAGQFAGLGIMLLPGHYPDMVIAQLTINIRYAFMAISLSQKADESFRGMYRWLLGFGTTDEVFAVAIMEETVAPSYYAGLILLPFLGWSGGTLFGALLGNVLPDRLTSALGMAIYGMFIAIVIPELKKGKELCIVVASALVLSCAFHYLPILNQVGSGMAITICAVLAAVFGAVCFPTASGKQLSE